jgi:hypothetical protein
MYRLNIAQSAYRINGYKGEKKGGYADTSKINRSMGSDVETSAVSVACPNSRGICCCCSAGLDRVAMQAKRW